MMTATSETRLQSFILAQLSIEPGCAVLRSGGEITGDPHPVALFWRQNTGFAMTTDGRGLRFGIAGQADITGVVRGRRVEIEVKLGRGRQSPEQRAFQAKIEAAGGLYIVAYKLDDVLRPIQQLLTAKGSCE